MGGAMISAIVLVLLVVLSAWLRADAMETELTARHLSPSWQHPFGTDWLGRDMLSRTISGLGMSIQVGLLGALGSSLIAAVMGLAAGTLGKSVDRIITWLIDVFLSVPHLVTLILIAFVTGGGLQGIVIGIALTHWPSLARVLRAEALQLRHAEYIEVSRKLGKTRWWIAVHHVAPHLVPQLLVGLLLLFPHAILHEAAITFLGLGLSPHQPAIGIILSESMRYLSVGMWWLAVFPGVGLILVVRLFDVMGERVRLWLSPHHSQE